MDESPQTPSGETILCCPTTEPAVKWFIIAAMLIGFGTWCWFDRANYPPPEAWDTEHINEAVKHAMNNWGPFIFVPVGAVCLALGIRQLIRKMAADSEGIGYSCGAKVLWTDVTGLDVSKLKDKGMLTICYGDGGKLVLDSYKLQEFRSLVAFVERHLPQHVSQAQSAETPQQSDEPDQASQ